MAVRYNKDVTTSILLRLPVKSLLRLKNVSKQWLSIVSSRQFRQIHAASASGVVTVSGLFLNNGTSENPKIDFLSLDNHTSPIPNSNQPFEILSSSGGLLLLLESNNQDYFILNPTTNEIKQLAAIPQFIRESRCVFPTLAFDASKSPHYKVLFGCGVPNNKFRFMIYSSETRTYRSVQTNDIDIHYSGVYCNDAIHWVAFRDNYVTYFDLNKECINVFRFPPVGRVLYSGESGGNLHIVTMAHAFYNPCRFSLFDVYELKTDYSGWSLNYNVDVASIQKEIPHICHFHTDVLSVSEDENEDLIMVIQVMDYFNTFVAYNLKKKLSNDLRPGASWYRKAYQYKATLACV